MKNKFKTKLIKGMMPKEFHQYKKKYITTAAKKTDDFTIETLEGTMKGHAGDYICIGPKGELYPCHKEIFEETYEEIKNEDNNN